MNPFMILAESEAPTGTLSTLVSSFTSAVGTQFAARALGRSEAYRLLQALR